jgi:hypothetical protein
MLSEMATPIFIAIIQGGLFGTIINNNKKHSETELIER